MAGTNIDRLIVNSPYEQPSQHWSYNRNQRLFNLSNDVDPQAA